MMEQDKVEAWIKQQPVLLQPFLYLVVGVGVFLFLVIGLPLATLWWLVRFPFRLNEKPDPNDPARRPDTLGW